MRSSHDRLWSCLIGGFGGLVVGAVVAVNFIIAVGIGYDVSPLEVFRQQPFVGFVAAAIQVGAPILGAIFIHRLRHPEKGHWKSGRSTGVE